MSDPFAPPTHRLDIAGTHVFLAMPTHRDIHPYTAISLLRTQTLFHEMRLPIDVEVTYGNSLPHHARTKAAWRFLQSKADRLFWVDSDMQWEPKDFVRLVALTNVMPIVAGAYTAKMDPPLFMVKGDLQAIEGNEYGCLALDGLGLGFTCMRREVVEALAERAPWKRFNGIKEPIPHLFHYDEGRDEGDAAGGEDMAFFADAKALGYQLWIDPTVDLGHIGPKVYRSSIANSLIKQEIS